MIDISMIIMYSLATLQWQNVGERYVVLITGFFQSSVAKCLNGVYFLKGHPP
jgi:hypothetical protein